MPAPDHVSPTGAPVIGQDSLIGFTADGITLENPLSESGSSRTFLGRRSDGQGLRVWVAADHLARDVAFVARFRQEATQLATLHHVNVESCCGHRTWPTADGRTLLALVEEASAGVALGDLARRESLPVRDVLRLLHQACAGLVAAHRVGIVHGDITPDAVLVTVGGAAKLRSFALGISGYSPERADRSLIGTPDYMAPEVGRGQQPSSLSDLYGIGAVLIAVLTGDVPFPAATALETIHLHGSAPVPDLAVSHPEFALVAPLITRLMAKDPAQRWMDVENLARDLLVLSNQIAGDVRCRPWSGRRSLPLAALVQTAMAQRRKEGPQIAPPQPPPKERSSGGTTTISRNSVDVFRNPELFKPTGLTPATGLPILPPSPDAPPKNRAVRRVEPVMTPVTPSAVLPETPALVAPPKTASYLSQLASSPSSTGTPPSDTSSGAKKRSLRWLVPAVVILVALVGLSVWVIRGRAEAPVSPPVVVAPVVPVEPPTESLAERINAITALGGRDPAAALAQASALRREQPTADLSRLPVALRLTVQGPEASALRVTRNGEPVVLSPGSLLCRVRGEALPLRIDAPGFRAQEVVIPASTADDLMHSIALLNEPHWALPAFAPTWVRLLPSPDGVLLASDRKVVLIAAGDGHELRRLDHSTAPVLPENLTWSSVLSVTPGTVRLGVSGGLCLDVGIAGLTPVSEIHRGQSSVLAFQLLPITLRLGEEGIFLIERETAGFSLAADNRERRLWSRPLKGAMMPWLGSLGDRLLVIGDHQIQRFSQEGEETAPLALPTPRTGVPVAAGAAGVFIPTTTGVMRLTTSLQALPGSSGPVYACVGDATMIVVAGGRGLVAWDIAGEQVKPRWSHTDLVATDHRLVHLTLTPEQVIVVDDQGVVQVFNRSEGTPLRTVRTGEALFAPPVLSGGRLITVLTPGVVAAF